MKCVAFLGLEVKKKKKNVEQQDAFTTDTLCSVHF